MADRPDWFEEGIRYLHQVAEREGMIPLPAIPRRQTLETPAAVEAAPQRRGDDRVVPEDEAPWSGTPPRSEKDPVGIPDSMTRPVPGDPAGRAALLARLATECAPCLKCSLGESRRNFVFGVGASDASIMFVGEAPGADEDERGEPFVGRAGRLLDKIIESIGLRREEVYIANILKCRPPENRDPQAHEVEACEPYLHRQLALIRPRVICALGRIAGQTLLRTNTSLTKLRGKVHRYRGVPLLVTYHPAALLRNPAWKRPTWEDMKQLRKIHDGEVTV